MRHYDQELPPVRDERLNIGDAYAGNACGLVDCSKSGCMIRNNRGFWQTVACQMALSLMMAATVENAAIVLHGAIGCGAQMHALGLASSRGKLVRGKTPGQPVWVSTNLKESDVIGGGEEKLRETIRYVDAEFRPEIIFVVVTCAPSIIGDNVEDVVRKTQDASAAEIVSIHCPGFRSRVVASAYDSFYHGLLRHISFEPEPYRDYRPPAPSDPQYELEVKKYEYIKNHTVNLWNATSIGPSDEDEVVRLLTALGLKVRIFAEYSNADEFRMVSQAGLNVSLCNVHDDYILKYLEEKYGIPYVIAGMPIGKAATRKWLISAAAHFGLEDEAGRLADYEERLLDDAIRPLLPGIRGKRVLLGGGVVRVGVEAAALSELGMDVIGVRAYHFDNNAESVYEDVAETLGETPVSVSNQAFELVNQIKEYRPDLLITHAGSHGIVAKLGVPSMQMFSPEKSYFGYNGLFAFLKNIAFALENPSYQKRLAMHVKQPYKDSWFEKDAFALVTEKIPKKI
ncbi:MAG: nitrogenase component 1 [Clostridiales Family XIII bacterium]|jgi:nitrogenase molybdenum-iron protein alpha chain|nr:nitrogenase component 1 [Clostridiales Family XIII bacterium]